MERLNSKCPGDCSTCELLASGAVKSMVVCAIDQIFQKQLKLQKDMDEVKEMLTGQQEVSLVNIKEDERDSEKTDRE